MSDKDGVVELRRRIDHLESTITHQQYDFEVLNQVVIEQTKEVSLLKRQVSQLEALLQNLNDRIPEDPRDPLSEKPPHY